MATAATAPHDFAPSTGASREFSAFLRLQQGGSTRSTWTITQTASGAMISVGADAACDWQVRAAFVPPRAFSILVVGGRAFVRSGPEPGLLIDGRPIDDSWVPLQAKTRVDIGLARFEVRTGYTEGEAPGDDELQLASPSQRPERVGAWNATAVVQRDSGARAATPRRKPVMETQEYRGPALGEYSRVQRVGVPEAQPRAVARPAARPSAQRTAPQHFAQERLVTPPAAGRAAPTRNATMEIGLDDLDYVGTIPRRRRMGELSGEWTVSPTLLGSQEVSRMKVGVFSPTLRYAGIFTFFACAYGAWLYLLDRL